MSARKLLVIGAHSADFVWRSAGSIAVTVANGGSASVVALSYGERGESGDLWRDNPEQTVENVKRIRHKMAEEAAGHVGASFRCLDLGDYPLHISNDNLAELVQMDVQLNESAPALNVRPTTELNGYQARVGSLSLCSA